MEESDVYKESCNSFRHYSRASTIMRVAAIAQGILLLSASGYLYRTDELMFTLITALFGAVFTIFLGILHLSYQTKAEIFIKSAREIEKSNEHIKVKAVTDCLANHEKTVATLLGDVFIVNGVFILMFISFCIVAISALPEF